MCLNRVRVPLLASAVWVLTACGGANNNEPQAISELQGVVAKGVVSGAKVSVLTLDTPPVVLASGVKTDKDGRYSVKFSAANVPIRIEVDLEGADIADELNPGLTYKGAKGDKIRAVIGSAKGVVSVNVTPFSEMAVQLVEATGWNPKAVPDANNLVRQLLNNTDHLTASPVKGALLTSLTAVQQMVNSTEGGLGVVLNRLREAATFESGKVSINPELIEALDAACGDSSECADAFATPPAPIVVGIGEKVDPVIALFQDLRDTLLAYTNKSKTGGLDVAASGIEHSMKNAVQPIDDEMLGVLAMFSEGQELYHAFKEGKAQEQYVYSGHVYGRIFTHLPNGDAVENEYIPRYGCELARARVVAKPNGAQDVEDYSVLNVTPENANVFGCFGVGTAGGIYPGLNGKEAYWHGVIFIPQEDGGFKYVHQLLSRPFDLRGAPDFNARIKVGYGNLGVNVNNSLAAFQLQGQLVPGLKGHTSSSYEALDRVDAALSFVGGDTSASSRRLDLSGKMTLYKNGNVFASSVEIARGSMVAVKTDVPYTYRDYIYGGELCPPSSNAAPWSSAPMLWCEIQVTGTEGGLSEMKLDVAVAAPGVKLQGIVTANTPLFDASKTVYTPTKMSLQGKIFEADASGYRLLLDGLGSVELSNYANYDAANGSTSPLKVAFDGKVLLKNRPEMALTLSGAKTRAGTQSLSGTFFWNSKALKFAAKADGSWTVSNDAGVRFTIPSGGAETDQDIFLGDVKVGTINFAKSRIDYADGRFQQF